MYNWFLGIKYCDPVKEILKMMSHLYFNDKSDYSEENTCENGVFHTTIEKN